MKNGIYLSLVLFLGVIGYFVVNGLFQENSIVGASLVFLLVSAVITVLVTHFKRKSELVPVQKILTVSYVGIFMLYGLYLGLSLSFESYAQLSVLALEGIVFILASALLVYGIYTFIKRHEHKRLA